MLHLLGIGILVLLFVGLFILAWKLTEFKYAVLMFLAAGGIIGLVFWAEFLMAS